MQQGVTDTRRSLRILADYPSETAQVTGTERPTWPGAARGSRRLRFCQVPIGVPLTDSTPPRVLSGGAHRNDGTMRVNSTLPVLTVRWAHLTCSIAFGAVAKHIRNASLTFTYVTLNGWPVTSVTFRHANPLLGTNGRLYRPRDALRTGKGLARAGKDHGRLTVLFWSDHRSSYACRECDDIFRIPLLVPVLRLVIT